MHCVPTNGARLRPVRWVRLGGQIARVPNQYRASKVEQGDTLPGRTEGRSSQEKSSFFSFGHDRPSHDAGINATPTRLRVHAHVETSGRIYLWCPPPPQNRIKNETTRSPRGAGRGGIDLYSGVVCGARAQQTTSSRVDMRFILLSPAKHDDVYLILRHVNALDACDPWRSSARVALHLHHLRAAQRKQKTANHGAQKDKSATTHKKRETTNSRIRKYH